MSALSRRPRVVAGIQARTGSTRLPRKVLAELEGRTLLERVVERARLAERVERVVVLTSDAAGDDELAALCAARGIDVRRGSEADVLARYLALAEEFAPDQLVRITGDCPLIEPAFIDRQLAALAAFEADFTFVVPGGIDGTLCGMGAFSRRALEAAATTTDPRDREHVGSFFFQRERARFRWVELAIDDVYRNAGVRLTVDEAQDLRLVRRIYARFAPDGARADFATADVLRWLARHPELAAWNGATPESRDNQALRGLQRVPDRPVVGRFP